MKILALILIITFAANAAAHDNTTPKTRTSLEGPLQRVIVTVQEWDGLTVTGLNINAFSLFDEKIPQEIVSVSETDEPLSCGVLFDISGSIMSSNPVVAFSAAKSVLDFIEHSNRENEYFLIGFDSQVQLITDWTRDPMFMIKGLTDLPKLHNKSNGTRLYDALFDGLSKIMTGSNGKKVILLFTDGLDFGSRNKFSRVKQMLRESDCLLYVFNLESGIGLSFSDIRNLSDLAWSSGGRDYYYLKPATADVKPNDPSLISNVLKSVATQLRHQYSLVYRLPNLARERKWRRIQVKVKAPSSASGKRKEIFVRHRAGYFPATANNVAAGQLN